jgi:NADPH2:quinone reductase
VKAVVCRSLDGPSALAVEDVASPTVQAGQIKVSVRASAVNYPDILMTEGKYQFKPPLPFIPGFESAGVVVEAGPEVKGWSAGDRVLTHQRVGGYAEQLVVAAHEATGLPEGMSFDEGAGFYVGALTAHVALHWRGQLQAGEVLLVHGAAGGMGLAAVEAGKLMGATVIGVARGEDRRAVVAAKGADHVIDPAEGIRDQVLEITGGRGADVVYDPVGGDAFDQSVRCIAWEGRIVIVGFASGRIAHLPTNLPLIKGFSVLGVRAGEFGRRNPEKGRRARETVLGWAAEGKLRPHISHRFPLDRAIDAMQMLIERKATGKVLLTMGG